MKTLIFAAFVIAVSVIGCTTSRPYESVYYPDQQPVYITSPYAYYNDPYYTPIYNYRYGQPYNGRYYNAPVYQHRDDRREYYEHHDRYTGHQGQNNDQRQVHVQQPVQQNNEVRVRQLPDGSRVSSNGTVTMPNGQVRRR